ncbi:UNVERIFIED_CONTAM: Cytochrome P450 4V2 [Trichonephila clavipes]
MRLYPSVPAFGRMIRNDIKIDYETKYYSVPIENYIVPKGSICLVHTFLLHRDPEFFPNPDKFDPDRFTQDNSVGRNPFAYVPFSAGPRNCIGKYQLRFVCFISIKKSKTLHVIIVKVLWVVFQT